jgi:hypothetical protein
MAKTSIVDEIEHHPQLCLDLSDPLGAIRMGNSIGRFGDRLPAPALGFNARDRYFHFRRTFDEGLHAFVENAFESRVRNRYSCHGRTRISGYRITGPLAAVLPSFVESVAGSRDLKRSAQIEFFLKDFGYSKCSGSRGQSILLSVSAGLPLVSLIVVVAIMYRYMVMA